MTLFGELRRRNVFKVGAAYAIVGWLLAQLAGFATDTFDAPDWVLQIFVIFLALGFPVAVILAWAYELTPRGIKAASEVHPTDSITHQTGQRLNYVIVGLLAVAVGFVLIDQYLLPPRTFGTAIDASQAALVETFDAVPEGVRRFVIPLGPSQGVGNTGLSAHVAISADGTQIVYATQVNGTTQLYHRRIDEFEARLLPGTEGAQFPFFSPDGEWIAFYSDDTDQALKKLTLRGGIPQVVARAQFSGGAAWADDGAIIYSTQDEQGGRSLFRIAATGGTPELLLESDENRGYVRPEVLPGSRAVLVTVRPGQGGGGASSEGRIAVLSLETRELKPLIAGGYAPRYTQTGHILFARAGALWAVPFDPDRLELTGPETVVVQKVQQDGYRGGAPYAVSTSGTLVYVSGAATGVAAVVRELVWISRDGSETPVGLAPRAYRFPRLSPNGNRLAIAAFEGGSWDIWTSDLARGTSGRLTFEPGSEFAPVWTPDGSRIVYGALDLEGYRLLVKRADGTGTAQSLVGSFSSQHFPRTFTPDAAKLLVEQPQPGDLLVAIMPLDPDAALDPMERTGAVEVDPALSADGRWLAYVSDELGPPEIFVRPFPNVADGKWQVSRGGGFQPQWSPDGRELFYTQAESMMVVAVEPGDVPTFGNPRSLFEAAFSSPRIDSPTYAVAPDGQRFLMLRDVDETAQAREEVHLLVVENWFDELRELAP